MVNILQGVGQNSHHQEFLSSRAFQKQAVTVSQKITLSVELSLKKTAQNPNLSSKKHRAGVAKRVWSRRTDKHISLWILNINHIENIVF